MPIIGFTWAQFKGGDIHVLRNNQPSVPLDETLIVVEEFTNLTDPDGNHKLLFKDLKTINSGVDAPPEFGQALFTPSWIGRATPTGPNLLTFNGITLNEKTGEITAVTVPIPNPPPPTPPARITSFFMEVKLEPSTGHTLSLPPNATPPLIAVHLHDSITKAWVTPSSLTARPDVVKGISNLSLKVISSKPIEKITWATDETFQRPISQFLLNGKDPFDGLTVFPRNADFAFPPALLFDNRKPFPINEVFVDPLHFEVKYAGQADPVHITIPTHLSHLIQLGQKFDDGAGNNVFEVSLLQKKAQYKASVYATFDDNTIGDVTNQHGLTWERGPGVNVNDITFDSGGAFEVATSAVGKTLPVRVQLPARLTGAGVTAATGNVIVRESWLNANPFAERLTGSPTQLPAADIPNVLFVGEGFTNRDEFRKAAVSVYNRLRDEPKTTPWNHLFKNRMNAWMLFEQSRESSASCLYESIGFKNVRLEDGKPHDIALPLGEILILGSDRLDDRAGLTIARLAALVGLPTPADGSAMLGAKIRDWRQLVDPNFGTGALVISNTEFEFWKRLSERILVEERDTAWGLRCGEKPKQSSIVGTNMIALNHEARLQRSNLDLFFSRVRADSASGDLIGERFWGRDRQGKFGKDYGLVVFLVGGARTIGTRFRETHFPQRDVNTGIGAGIVDDRVMQNFLGPQFSGTFPFFLWKKSAQSFELEPFPVPASVPLAPFATIAHELCHSFNVEDEYSLLGRDLMPAADQARLVSVFNLQGRNDLVSAGQLAGEKIKWRWPRIKKAGVLESAPTVGPQISVTLRAGDVAQFVVDEIVRFRHRDILKTPHNDLSSPDLKVRGKNETDRTVLLEPLATTTVDWAAFGPNSLLYAPVKAPTESRNNPTGDVYGEVLSPLMRDHISKPGPGHQSKTPCENEEEREQTPVNLPANLIRPKEHRRIVGLFSGGKEFACDVYHASGECIMRKETGLFTPRGLGVDPTRDRQTYQFCQVCRYSLVDQIDPKQHNEIDKQYDENYPLTEKPTSVLKIIGIVAGLILLLVIGYVISKDKKDN